MPGFRFDRFLWHTVGARSNRCGPSNPRIDPLGIAPDAPHCIERTHPSVPVGDIQHVAVKIKLKRLGKIRMPQYRIIIADSRTKRDGRAIEEIGLYHPKEDPSRIEVNSERAQYWLSVGAQPTEPVLAILKVTGDWQKFKGLPGAEGTLRVAEAPVD